MKERDITRGVRKRRAVLAKQHERAIKQRLIDKGWATEEELKEIDKEVRDIVADSADFAQNDPEPDASELYTDILL